MNRKRYPLGSLQFWLQGHPNKYRPWWVARIGNWLSAARFYAWKVGTAEGRRAA